jgi:[ribosomal protein S5]-alanine N-acetyltransferase
LYFQAFSDPNVVEHALWRPHIIVQETHRFILRIIEDRNRQPRTNYEFVIDLISESRLIGYTILQINHKNKSAERGMFLHKSKWNKGLATEAQSAMLEFGFETLGLHRIWATCYPNNFSSINVIKKTGMKYEGLLRENVGDLKDQTYKDSMLFSILKYEWEELENKKHNK